MLPSMRFFIISIVSIFAALGIGILIGFTINSQDFIIEQNTIISDIMESQLEGLIKENREIKENERILIWENNYKEEFINNSYDFIIESKLRGLKIAIIETNEDYVTSSIGRDLELAGAKVLNVTTISNDFINKDSLDHMFKEANLSIPKNSIETSLNILAESIITNRIHPIFNNLVDAGYIKTLGIYNEKVDYLILCGGSRKDASKRINQIDRLIVEYVRNYDIPIIGVEKFDVVYSYMSGYKELGITTIDNVDMLIGRIALILAMNDISGNYGIKSTADSVIPKRNLLLQ